VQAEITAFLRHLDRERNASPHTVRAYGEDLGQFARHVRAELGREGRPQDVDHLLIRAFLARLHRQGLKSVSAARKLATLRTFFRYLCREGVLDRNPARSLLSPRLEKRVPTHLDESDVALLVEMPGDGDAAVRGRAILELLYATGIRCSELVGLDLGEIDRSGRMIRVLGKGRKERIVPFGGRAGAAIDAYLPVRGQARPRTDALFINARGGRLSDRSIRLLVAPTREGRGTCKAGQPAYPAAQLRHPSPGKGRGPAGHPGAARARQPFHDSAIYARQYAAFAGDIQ
jgi:integrase/recombinase XerC